MTRQGVTCNEVMPNRCAGLLHGAGPPELHAGLYRVRRATTAVTLLAKALYIAVLFLGGVCGCIWFYSWCLMQWPDPLAWLISTAAGIAWFCFVFGQVRRLVPLP